MEISIKEKVMSIVGGIVAIILLIALLTAACSPRPSPSYNTEEIQVGDCIEHVINPEVRGVVLRTTRNHVSARRGDTQTRVVWQYPEVRRIQCPRGN